MALNCHTGTVTAYRCTSVNRARSEGAGSCCDMSGNGARSAEEDAIGESVEDEEDDDDEAERLDVAVAVSVLKLGSEVGRGIVE
jgi:hypothetical protein